MTASKRRTHYNDMVLKKDQEIASLRAAVAGEQAHCKIEYAKRIAADAELKRWKDCEYESQVARLEAMRRMQEALCEINYGALSQGLHTGLSWDQVYKISSAALSAEAPAQEGGAK